MRAEPYMPTVTDRAAGERAAGVSYPRLTRAAAVAVIVGVLAQAALAGGFLAGHAALVQVHMAVGGLLVLSGATLVVAGLVGRRRSREPRSLLAARVGVLLLLLVTASAGLAAGGGTRDLLMLHIPLAILSMGLSSRLLDASGAAARRRQPERRR